MHSIVLVGVLIIVIIFGTYHPSNPLFSTKIKSILKNSIHILQILFEVSFENIYYIITLNE